MLRVFLSIDSSYLFSGSHLMLPELRVLVRASFPGLLCPLLQTFTHEASCGHTSDLTHLLSELS